MSIRSRFLVGFLSILAILLIAGWISLRRLERQLEASIGDSSATVARSVLSRLEQEIYARVEQIEILARTTPEIERLLARSNAELAAIGDRSAIERLIAERDAAWARAAASGTVEDPLIRSVSEQGVSALLSRKQAFLRQLRGREVFAEIFVTNAYGVNAAQTAVTSDYRQDDEEWWIAGRRDGVWLSPVSFDDSSGVYSIDFVVRIDDPAGNLLGQLKAVLDIAEIAELLAGFAAQTAEEGGTVELIDGRGARLFPSFRPPPPAPPAPRGPYWREADGSGEERLLVEVGTAGHPRYPDLGWRLISSRPAAAVFAPVTALKQRLAITVLIAALLAAAAALAVSLPIASSLEQAVTVAGRLAQGELDFEFDQRGSGEAGMLLAAMGAMLSNVQRIIGQMIDSAHHTAALAERLSSTAHGISAGAERQSRATAESKESMAAMVSSTEQVAASIGDVASEVEATSRAIATMARSIATVAANAERQAATLEETFSHVHQLTASVEGVAGDAAAAGRATGEAVREARAGEQAVRETAGGMEEVARTIDDIVAVNARLAERGRRISRITEVIEGIAGQSSMLALNAAIQATKAGAHGRGFTVVAEEIQTLAERSAASAHEIAQLVEDLQAGTDDATRITRLGAERARRGVELAEHAGAALVRIGRTVDAIRATMDEIIARTQQQAETAEAMRERFEHMLGMTEEVTAETRRLRQDRSRIRAAMELLESVTREVPPVLERHRVDARRVDRAIERIAEISAGNVGTATAIVQVIEELQAEAEALRALADFFHVGATRTAAEGSVPPAAGNPR
ncbi:MAG: HAMP domain-containing protein [Acidobacteria bacterium]|nr:MAG: HAMP domain-containing protein [Acidobacteriota bacterium]